MPGGRKLRDARRRAKPFSPKGRPSRGTAVDGEVGRSAPDRIGQGIHYLAGQGPVSRPGLDDREGIGFVQEPPKLLDLRRQQDAEDGGHVGGRDEVAAFADGPPPVEPPLAVERGIHERGERDRALPGDPSPQQFGDRSPISRSVAHRER